MSCNVHFTTIYGSNTSINERISNWQHAHVQYSTLRQLDKPALIKIITNNYGRRFKASNCKHSNKFCKLTNKIRTKGRIRRKISSCGKELNFYGMFEIVRDSLITGVRRNGKRPRRKPSVFGERRNYKTQLQKANEISNNRRSELGFARLSYYTLSLSTFYSELRDSSASLNWKSARYKTSHLVKKNVKIHKDISRRKSSENKWILNIRLDVVRHGVNLYFYKIGLNHHETTIVKDFDCNRHKSPGTVNTIGKISGSKEHQWRIVAAKSQWNGSQNERGGSEDTIRSSNTIFHEQQMSSRKLLESCSCLFFKFEIQRINATTTIVPNAAFTAAASRAAQQVMAAFTPTGSCLVEPLVDYSRRSNRGIILIEPVDPLLA
ncbi:hypothetical protein WN51_04001 [Melipona quadrifasciata]|uniref:Uncharacterized protein n=1 Tax=Melipona quadrifasciata TaxID=166423 RepID=A0A0M8ZPM5_9HYME|nr:hypothetical protein WN51_04001 [Melipona quadrifasciata]